MILAHIFGFLQLHQLNSITNIIGVNLDLVSQLLLKCNRLNNTMHHTAVAFIAESDKCNSLKMNVLHIILEINIGRQ